MRLLLDTATLIFAADDPGRLSKLASSALQNVDTIREFSAISLTEIAIKNALGKLKMPKDRVHQAMEDLIVRVLPFTAEHAYRMFELPSHHRDPFDRQIVAQALVEGIPLVTPDDGLRRYEGLRVIW